MSDNVVTRTFPKVTLSEVVWAGVGDSIDGLTVVKQGEWVNEGKFDYKDVVFECDGEHYMVTLGRSGSYYSDYTYDSEWWDDEVECVKVEKVVVTKYEWHPVKAS